MEKRNLQNTQKRQNKSKSKPIRQSTSGQKNLKVTNRGQGQINSPLMIEKRQGLIRDTLSPKTKKNQSKEKDLQVKKVQKNSNKLARQKQNIRDQPTLNTDVNQSASELKISNIQIQYPFQDDLLNSTQGLVLNSKNINQSEKGSLCGTQINRKKVKSIETKQNMPQIQVKQRPNIHFTNLNNEASKKDGRASSSNNKLRKTEQKSSLDTKKIINLSMSNKGGGRQISKTIKNNLSKAKIQIKQQQRSQSTKKDSSDKSKFTALINQCRIPKPKIIPKQINPGKSLRKTSCQKTQNNQKTKENIHKNSQKNDPSFEQLQMLREQNQKYKMFLASSAFKVEQLRRQIEQHKQIRQNQKNIYNFQLNNLRKQLDCNKKYLGHLFSYDEPNQGKKLIPDQIIIETDNENSSVQDSLQIINQISKNFGFDQKSSNNSKKNQISNEQSKVIIESQPNSSSNQYQNSRVSQMNEFDELIKGLKEDLEKQEATSLKFLSKIQKIPSLEVQLSLSESQMEVQTSSNLQDSGAISLSQKHNLKKTFNKFSSIQNDNGSGSLLLLNSVRK